MPIKIAAPCVVGQCGKCKQPIVLEGSTLKCACRSESTRKVGDDYDVCEHCKHLSYSRYDPSPHGVGLGAGWMYDVECDTDKCSDVPPYGAFEWRECECPSCGAEIAEDATECPVCGAEFGGK